MRQFDRPQPPQQPQQPPMFKPQVIKTYWHDTNAFTEGLQIVGDLLYESTGLEGQSWFAKRKLMPNATAALRKKSLDAKYFGEGICVLGKKLYQLTWRNQLGFIYDAESFEKIGEFRYKGEGWALTTDGKQLIMSDGTPNLRFLDPSDPNKEIRSRLKVTVMGQTPQVPWSQLNEIEWYKGEILSNVWTTDFIYRINPKSGVVTGVIDCTELFPARDRPQSADVLNGIAYDAKLEKLYLTGKNWPKIYEVKLVPK
jgi:glutaminyl-peptide cyclotransferase